MILYIYIAPGQGLTIPWGWNFYVLCQQEHLVTLVICCKFKRYFFEVWFYTFFFIILYMYIAPGQGQTAPRGQSFVANRNVLSLHSFVASLKKNGFKVWFYTFFFIALGQGQTAPRGQNFDVNRKALSLYPLVASFKEISLKSDFIQFFHDLIQVYSPGAGGQTAPRGHSFDVNRNFLSLRSFVASFKS